MEKARLISPMLETTNVWLSAAILIAAGLWQLRPIKTNVPAPLSDAAQLLVSHWRGGRWGALRMGLEHGGINAIQRRHGGQGRS